jgi:hypothetical protein
MLSSSTLAPKILSRDRVDKRSGIGHEPNHHVRVE